MNAAQALLERILSHGAYLERYEKAELAKMLELLERAHEEVIGKIAKTYGAGTRDWLAQVGQDIENVYRAVTQELRGVLFTDLQDFATSELDNAYQTFNSVLAGVSTTAPSPSLLWSAITSLPAVPGSTLDNLLEGLSLNSRKAIFEAVQVGMTSGDTLDQMTKRLRGRVIKRASWRKGADGKRYYVPGIYEGGAMEDTTTAQAKKLARTAIMHVSNQAREKVYAENEDIIKGYQRVETLDLNTCLMCGSQDGRVYKIDEARPELPAHPGCRGVWVPVLKSWKELGIDMEELPPGTRASMNGQVPEYETYNDRMGKLSSAKRKALLGPTRAKLFEAGVPVEKMVRNDGRVIPLKELGHARPARVASPVRDKFTPAKTVKEAEAWARKHDLADTVLFGKLTVEVANTVNETIWGYYEQFPELRGEMRILGSNQAIRKWYVERRAKELVPEFRRLNGDASYSDEHYHTRAKKHAEKEFPRTPAHTWAIAYHAKDINGITVNENAAKKLDVFTKSLKRNVEQGFHPIGCDTVKSVIDHEVGHRLDTLLGRISRDDIFTAAGIKDLSQREKVSRIASELSRYGATNNAELLAEAWSEYRNNKTPRPIAQGIGDWVLSRYKSWKESRSERAEAEAN